MALDLSKLGERGKLKARREPYWQRLRAGCFLGFRPSKRGGKGTWIARAYDEDAGKYRSKSLGDLGHLAGNEIFAVARKEADAFADFIQSGGQLQKKIITVTDACRKYAAGRQDAEGRFKRHVYGDPLAKVKLDKLRRHHLLEWRERLTLRPAPISRNKEGERLTRARAPASINRDMVPLRAALFKVLAPGTPGTEAAWQEALTPIRNADRQRTVYLDKAQRRALLQYINDEAKAFVTALAQLPLRPGALAGLSAGDYDKRTRELTIRKDKTGRPRRIAVPARMGNFLEEQVRGKLPDAPMFMRSGGHRWTKEYWNDPIKAASAAAGTGADVTAYTLRHSAITDLITGKATILDVAKLSDTSVQMIERHYGHLTRLGAEQALAKIAL